MTENVCLILSRQYLFVLLRPRIIIYVRFYKPHHAPDSQQAYQLRNLTLAIGMSMQVRTHLIQKEDDRQEPTL